MRISSYYDTCSQTFSRACHYGPNYGPDSFLRWSDTGWLPSDDAMNVDSRHPLLLPTTCVGGSTDDHWGWEPMSPSDCHVCPTVADDWDLPPACMPPANSFHSVWLPLVDDHAARPPLAVHDSDVRPIAQSADVAHHTPLSLDDWSAQPPVPLEDCITHGPPQDKVTQSRADDHLQDEGHYCQTRVLLSLKSCEYSDVCSGASRHQPDILLKLLNWKKGEKIVKLVISCTLLSKIWVFYYAIVKSTTKVTLWHLRDQRKFNVFDWS